MIADPFGATPKAFGLGNYPVCGRRRLYMPIGLVGAKLQYLCFQKFKKIKRRRVQFPSASAKATP
jgi:hypothetical protein